MGDLTTYIEKAHEKGMTHAIVVDTAKVFTAPWVAMKCRFGCPMYGKAHCCPPCTPSYEETRAVLDSYKCGILLHHHWVGKGEGLRAYVERLKEFNEAMTDLESTIFFDGYYKAFAMESGPCRRCTNCNIAGPCSNPLRARPSMESCGIDVFKTVRENGLSIRTLHLKEEEKDSYGLILVE